MCPAGFKDEDLPRGPLPPSKDARCNTFRRNLYNSYQLDTLASSVLHEFFRWDFLMGDATRNRHMIDYTAKGDASNTDQDPVDGYGPYNALRMAVRNRNTVLNADSYVQFAK